MPALDLHGTGTLATRPERTPPLDDGPRFAGPGTELTPDDINDLWGNPRGLLTALGGDPDDDDDALANAIDAVLAAKISAGETLDRLADGDGFVRMTSSERTKLASLAVFAGATVSQITDASANGRSLISASDYAAMRSLLALVVGTNVQAYDQDLKSGLTVNAQSAAYTAVRGDANGTIYHPSSDNNARTFTIPANATVAYPVGTTLTFVNDVNTVTIAIASDTLVLAGSGGIGSRTLAANGVATAVKVAATRWYISGAGLS